MNTQFFPSLQKYVEASIGRFNSISESRMDELEKLAEFIIVRINSGQEVNLNFICTHNSRRSHLSQIWAATAAAYYNLSSINTFSGGTEATAFNPRAVAAVERAGFKVENRGGENPHYKISYADEAPEMECFSKTFDDKINSPE